MSQYDYDPSGRSYTKKQFQVENLDGSLYMGTTKEYDALVANAQVVELSPREVALVKDRLGTEFYVRRIDDEAAERRWADCRMMEFQRRGHR